MVSSRREFADDSQNSSRQFALDMLKLCELYGRRVAFHARCADGIVSAALLRKYGLGDIFVPVDYGSLREDAVLSIIRKLPWFAILDLEPFADSHLELYIDHHSSTIGRRIPAQSIHFETGVNGSSTALVLARSGLLPVTIPQYLAELVEMTKITDTASFAIDPPITTARASEIRYDMAEKVWILDDACKSAKEVTQLVELVELLSDGGFSEILKPSILARVNLLRKHRKSGVLRAKEFIATEFTIIITRKDSLYLDSVMWSILGRPEAKIVVAFQIIKGGTRISLRKSKTFEKSAFGQHNSTDLAAFAGSINGGGHAYSSGGWMPDLEEALDRVRAFARTLKMQIVEHIV